MGKGARLDPRQWCGFWAVTVIGIWRVVQAGRQSQTMQLRQCPTRQGLGRVDEALFWGYGWCYVWAGLDLDKADQSDDADVQLDCVMWRV